MDDKQIERISRALADPHRIRILKAVKDKGWMQCSAILDMIDLTQPAISHHLKQLTEADLLISEKEGRNMKYTVNKEVLAAYKEFLGEIAGKTQ
jgi:ArsR family transcriptional regulator, arsenate/arsenite/antimonite-responsive transcriptional repressor